MENTTNLHTHTAEKIQNPELFAQKINVRFIELLRNKEFALNALSLIVGYDNYQTCDQKELLESIYASTLEYYEKNNGVKVMTYEEFSDFFSNKENETEFKKFTETVSVPTTNPHTIIVGYDDNHPEHSRNNTLMLYHNHIPYNAKADLGPSQDPFTERIPYTLEYDYIITKHTHKDRKRVGEPVVAQTSLVIEFLIPFLIRKSFEERLNNEIDELKSLNSDDLNFYQKARLTALNTQRRFFLVTAGDEDSGKEIVANYSENMMALAQGMNRQQEQEDFRSLFIDIVSEHLAPHSALVLQLRGLKTFKSLANKVANKLNSGISKVATKISDIYIEFRPIFGKGPNTMLGFLESQLVMGEKRKNEPREQ